MKYIITIFQDEDGMFITECPQIPGCVSQGRSEDEALANIKLAIKECMEVRLEMGLPPLVNMHVKEVLV